jgi:hypothetical protein
VLDLGLVLGSGLRSCLEFLLGLKFRFRAVVKVSIRVKDKGRITPWARAPTSAKVKVRVMVCLMFKYI